MSLSLTSSDFSTGGTIPEQHTCDGADLSPSLSWSGAPPGTKSFALVVDDPDAPDPAAPKTTWVHWVLYNIPPETAELPQGSRESALPKGILAGRNDWNKAAYGGPCPPIGRHRYFHKLYALDVVLPDLGQPTKKQLEQAMHGHVLEQCELVGTYERPSATG